MKKVIAGMMLALAALASDDLKNDDGQVTVAGLHGTWRVVSGEQRGKPLPEEEFKGLKLIFKGNTATIFDGGRKETATFRTDSSRQPAYLDITFDSGKGGRMKWIYLLDGDTLKVAITEDNKEMRPTGFKTGPGPDVVVLVLKREGN